MDSPLIILDTETCTLQGAPHLLELGAVKVVDGEIEDQFESLCCPQVEIDADATAIHGIRQEDVLQAPLTAQVLEEFKQWAGESWMAAHNANFDATVLGFEYARIELAPPTGCFIDSLTLARKYIPESSDHKRVTLCQHLELEEAPHHRALSDAVYCWMVIAECMQRMAEQGLDDSWNSLAAHCGAPLTIESSIPRGPKISSRLRALERATASGDEITLLYGTQGDSPTQLGVRPRFLYQRHKTGYLEAECLRSNSLKTYRLDRVQKILPRD